MKRLKTTLPTYQIIDKTNNKTNKRPSQNKTKQVEGSSIFNQKSSRIKQNFINIKMRVEDCGSDESSSSGSSCCPAHSLNFLLDYYESYCETPEAMTASAMINLARLILVILICVLLVKLRLSHLKLLPPGPMGFPFLGYLPFVGQEIHLTLTSLSNRYGPIYQIFLGNIRVVVLNDASLVRQAFKQPVFSGRPDTQLTRILQGYGIVNSDGALWKEQRAFLHTALRKLGAKSLMNGSNGLEAKIQVSFL